MTQTEAWFLLQKMKAPFTASKAAEFKEMLAVLSEKPEPRMIPHLIHCFGFVGEPRMMKEVQKFLRLFGLELLRPHLSKGLSHKNAEIRSWCAETIRYFPDPVFIPKLKKMLKDQNCLVRLSGAMALEKIQDEKTSVIAHKALQKEEDEDIKQVLSAITMAWAVL